jgi:hypothetical protein
LFGFFGRAVASLPIEGLLEFVPWSFGGFFQEAVAAEDGVAFIPEPGDAEAAGGFEFVEIVVEFAALGVIADEGRGGQALEELVELGDFGGMVALAFFKKVEQWKSIVRAEGKNPASGTGKDLGCLDRHG